MPVTYWTEDEVEQHTRWIVEQERMRCAQIVRDMQIKHASDACGWALDKIRNPEALVDEHSKFGF